MRTGVTSSQTTYAARTLAGIVSYSLVARICYHTGRTLNDDGSFETVLPRLLALRQYLWFQHDGAAPHYWEMSETG